RWRGQQPVPLPSGVTARRRGDRIAMVGPGNAGSGRRGAAGGYSRGAGPTPVDPRPSPRRRVAGRPDAAEGQQVSHAGVSMPDFDHARPGQRVRDDAPPSPARRPEETLGGEGDEIVPVQAPGVTMPGVAPALAGDIGEVLVTADEIA